MSHTSNPNEEVPENVRDAVFKELKSINKNNICIDCQKKNPKWASVHLGVHLCIDCAGKHRQYGVMYSFVKSTNLDVWSKRNLLFMQKGSNQRAMEYLRKCGAISDNQKHIDYKSPIIKKYKEIITAEVDSELSGKPVTVAPVVMAKKTDIFEEEEERPNVPAEIPLAEEVQNEEKGKKKKGKKKMVNKINLEDFDTMVFDDGVPIEQKQKIVRAYESSAKAAVESEKTEKQSSQYGESDVDGVHDSRQPTVEEVEKARELTEVQSKLKLEELKANQNLKSISSDAFKDTSADQQNMKTNLNKFTGSQSISSSALFGETEESQSEDSVAKIKDFVTDAGGKIYGKLASYWGKG